MGTVAGVGKLFNSGGQLLMGFASELVFNFAGKNPRTADGALVAAVQLCAAPACAAAAGR